MRARNGGRRGRMAEAPANAASARYGSNGKVSPMAQRIYIIEDDAALRDELAHVLELSGYAVAAYEGTWADTAARALADLVSDEELSEDFIMPDPFDGRVADVVAAAVREAAGTERAGA